MRRLVAALALVVLVGCARLEVPAISLDRPVVQGGQRELDRGNVVEFVDLPGIWIAGHRTTHGSAFRRLPELQPGDDVWLSGRHYRVERLTSLPHVIPWPPPYLGPLVLQTSLGRASDPVLLVVCVPA